MNDTTWDRVFNAVIWITLISLVVIFAKMVIGTL